MQVIRNTQAVNKQGHSSNVKFAHQNAVISLITLYVVTHLSSSSF